MQMLHAGGYPLLSDGLREADANNPPGYFELEAVKQINRNNQFIAEAKGKAVKIVAPLLHYLPGAGSYYVIS